MKGLLVERFRALGFPFKGCSYKGFLERRVFSWKGLGLWGFLLKGVPIKASSTKGRVSGLSESKVLGESAFRDLGFRVGSFGWGFWVFRFSGFRE